MSLFMLYSYSPSQPSLLSVGPSKVLLKSRPVEFCWCTSSVARKASILHTNIVLSSLSGSQPQGLLSTCHNLQKPFCLLSLFLIISRAQHVETIFTPHSLRIRQTIISAVLQPERAATSLLSTSKFNNFETAE